MMVSLTTIFFLRQLEAKMLTQSYEVDEQHIVNRIFQFTQQLFNCLTSKD